jgi:hypothetical protein
MKNFGENTVDKELKDISMPKYPQKILDFGDFKAWIEEARTDYFDDTAMFVIACKFPIRMSREFFEDIENFEQYLNISIKNNLQTAADMIRRENDEKNANRRQSN